MTLISRRIAIALYVTGSFVLLTVPFLIRIVLGIPVLYGF